MVEELAVEMAFPPKKPFWLSPKGLAILAGCACVLIAGLLSWWLANGTIKSASARLDTLVFTVEPEFSTRISKILVSPGENVQSGQALATIDVSVFMGENSATDLSSNISGRLNHAMQTERNLTFRTNQARADEERLQKIYQEMVTNHVRAQLAMRSARSQGAYEQAAQIENAARVRMNEANAAFEQASRARAALDQELHKIRYQLIRSGIKPETFKAQAAAAPEPVPQISNEIVAPVSGKIMRIDAQPGQPVQKSQTIFIIMPTGHDYISNLWVEAWFPIEKSKAIEIGQQALIKFPNNIHLEGKVQEIAAPVNLAQGNVSLGSTDIQNRPDQDRYLPVRISLDNPSDASSIQPGSKAECQIQTRYLMGFTWFN